MNIITRDQTEVRQMPEYDTCFYWGGEACIFQFNCPHEGPDGECNADDEELLTWEDYQQNLQTSSRTDE